MNRAVRTAVPVRVTSLTCQYPDPYSVCMTARERRSHGAILRAIIYARVSKDDSTRARSCDEQIVSCTDDCDDEGWPIGDVLKDNDRGASRHSRREREDFKKLPSILRAGDVLLVWEPSRITRDMREFGSFCDLMAERGVLLYYEGRLYDVNDDDDRNRVWQDILDGAKQVGKTRKRVLRAMAANLSENKPHGRVAPGYQLVRDPRSGKVVDRVPHPLQAPLLQEAARRLLDHESSRSVSRSIAPRWKEAGGGRFDLCDIRRILTSPTTYGFRVHYGEVVGTGKWEPVLNPELYRPIVGLLSRPATHRGVEPKYLLSHIAKCGVCLEERKHPGTIERKGRLKNEKQSTKRGADRYTCTVCHGVTRNLERVDDHVEEFLFSELERPDALAKLTARDEADRVSVDEELATIDRLTAERDQFVVDAAKTRMSAQAVAVYVEQIEAQITATQERLNARTASVDPLLLDLVGPDARRRWKALELEQRRDIIRRHLSVTIMRWNRKVSDICVEVRPANASVLAA